MRRRTRAPTELQWIERGNVPRHRRDGGKHISSSFFEYPGDNDEPSPPTAPMVEPAVFLADLGDAEWDRLLAYTEVRRFVPGEVVLTQQSTDRSLYIVADGELSVEGLERATFATITTGAVLGESAFLDGAPPDATVRAVTDVDLLALSPESFEVLAAREPALARAVLTDLGRVLSRRLRAAP